MGGIDGKTCIPFKDQSLHNGTLFLTIEVLIIFHSAQLALQYTHGGKTLLQSDEF